MRIALWPVWPSTRGRLPIGGAGDDQAVHFLQRPTLPHQLDREPIEQLGMRGQLALKAEVFGRTGRARGRTGPPTGDSSPPGPPADCDRRQPAGQRQPVRAAPASNGGRQLSTSAVTASLGCKTRPDGGDTSPGMSRGPLRHHQRRRIGRQLVAQPLIASRAGASSGRPERSYSQPLSIGGTAGRGPGPRPPCPGQALDFG